MSVYSFAMNLVAPGGFSAPFSRPGEAGGRVGSAIHRDEVLDEDDEPAASDIPAVLDQITKDKQCEIYWYPDKGHSFEPLKGKPSNRHVVLYLFLSIREKKDSDTASFRYQVTLQGLKVINVTKDPRMGHQAVKIGFESLKYERK